MLSFRFRKKENITPRIYLLHEFAPPIVLPKRPEIWRLEIATIMSAHDCPDSLRSLSCMIEWDPRAMMMHNVCFNGTVEDVFSYEAEIPINRRGSTSQKCPRLGWVVRY